jgi:hypothetical protein
LEEWVQGRGATLRVDQARYTLCTLRRPRYRSFTVATVRSSGEAALRQPAEQADPSRSTSRPPGCLSDQVWRGGGLENRKRAAPAGGAKRETARIAADRSPERPLADPEPLHRVEAPTTVGAGDHLISATHRIIGGGSSIQDCASSLVTGLHSAERLRTRADLDPPRRRRLGRPPRPVKHRQVISRDGGVARPQRRSTAPMRQAWLCSVGWSECC